MDKQLVDRQISEATNAHSAWRDKLKVAAHSGELPKPAAKIAVDDDCPFGKWIYSLEADPSFTPCDEFHEVKRKHALFHKYAGEIAAHVECGDLSSAVAELNSPQLGSRSFALLDAMKRWQNALN